MTTTTMTAEIHSASGQMEYATFYLGDLLLGIDIHKIQEINRQLDMTEAPHSPDYVRGVVNLRGDVVTVIDLRRVLELEPGVIDKQSRNIVLNSEGEQIGLLIDRIADVITATADEIDPPMANLHGIDGRFFKGVYKLDSELMVILDVEEILTVR